MIEIVQGIIDNDFFKLTVAFLLALPVAYNREQSTRIMGLRTFPLVSIATCAYILLGHTFIEVSQVDAQARIIQGVVAGIGFVGGGAILKQEDRVIGTASAASIWTMGAIGIAIAYTRYDIAVFLTSANFLILYGFTPLKKRPTPSDEG